MVYVMARLKLHGNYNWRITQSDGTSNILYRWMDVWWIDRQDLDYWNHEQLPFNWEVICCGDHN